MSNLFNQPIPVVANILRPITVGIASNSGTSLIVDFISEGQLFVIPENFQWQPFEAVTIEGQVRNEGKIIIW